MRCVFWGFWMLFVQIKCKKKTTSREFILLWNLLSLQTLTQQTQRQLWFFSQYFILKYHDTWRPVILIWLKLANVTRARLGLWALIWFAATRERLQILKVKWLKCWLKYTQNVFVNVWQTHESHTIQADIFSQRRSWTFPSVYSAGANTLAGLLAMQRWHTKHCQN